jgi:hypothetical protein
MEGISMEKSPQEALDLIRQKLQVILLRADLCENSGQCELCAGSVCDIVKEVRELERFIRAAASKTT